MRHESRQFVEVALPFLVPTLAGIAVFLFVWLLLRHPLQRLVDRLFPAGRTSRQVPETVHVPFERSGAGSVPGRAGRGDGVGQGSEPAEAAHDGSASVPTPLDGSRREHHLAEWRQAEAQFVREPAEAVRRAERLLRELAREGGSASVVRALMHEGRSGPGVVNRPAGFGGDAEFGAALAEAAVGIVRLIRGARAAARRRSRAVEHRGPSADDLRERMDLYRAVVGQLLDAEHGEPDALGIVPAASDDDARVRRDLPHARPAGTFGARAARERQFVGWYVLQLVLSLAFGLATLALVFWVLSQ